MWLFLADSRNVLLLLLRLHWKPLVEMERSLQKFTFYEPHVQ